MHPRQRGVPATIALVANAVVLLVPASGHAAGFYLQEQSVRGTGRAYSGEAADQGPSSLWWNPASIAGIAQSELDTGLSGVLVWSKASDRGSSIFRDGYRIPLDGADHSNVVQDGVVPNMAAALRLTHQWALGLSVTAPFSFITQYPLESWARYAALTSRLEIIDVQPSLAWRPTSWLGLGGGPNIEHGLAVLSSALPNLLPYQADGIETLHAKGWNVGYNVGLQLHLFEERLTFGFSYRSHIDHSLKGEISVVGLSGYLAPGNFSAGNAKGSFTTPWAATFGARFRVTDRLTLDAQLVRTGWSEFSNIQITRPIVSTTPENYSDRTSIAVGADYRIAPGWIVRGGVQRDPTPTPGSGRDPRIPDSDRWLFSVGTSLHVARHLDIVAGASYIDFATSNIRRSVTAYAGTPLATPISLNGDIAASGVVLALGTRITF